MRKDGVRAAREATREEVVFSPLRAREGVREAREATCEEDLAALALASRVQEWSGEAHEERKEATQEAVREGVNLCANRCEVSATISSENFFEVDQRRTSCGELLTVHPSFNLLTPNSLQVAPQDSNTTNTQEADLILNMLLKIDYDCRKVIIIKLVSNFHLSTHPSPRNTHFLQYDVQENDRQTSSHVTACRRPPLPIRPIP
jgi:hypothetical protein